MIAPIEDQTIEQLIADWNQADQQQKFWRDKETTLRAELVTKLYTKTKGTEHIPLRAGWELTIERGEDYKLNNKNGEVLALVDELSEEVAGLVLKWVPEIVKRNYDALSEETKAKFNNVLTIKPASPQVKLLPPKVPQGVAI